MGIPELLIIALAILVLFGAKRIPEMIKGIGKSISDLNSEENESPEEEEAGKKQ